MRDERIGQFLERLAARTPAPGGGASAALHAAQAAALVAMVARYSTGPKYIEHRQLMDQIVGGADDLRETALELMAADARAFSAVAEAYALPKATGPERESRSVAIAAALIEAARPPSDVIDVAANVIALAERLAPVGNRNVITDIAAAADAARAAATTARINVEVNLAGITDDQARRELVATIAGVDELIDRADRVSAEIRVVIER
jgi:formiminotetrahydrofolate cyclodeaminase